MKQQASVLWLCLGFLVILGNQSAQALPSFARHEQVSCQLCHTRMPEMNDEGRAYLLRGLRESSAGTTKAATQPTLGEPTPIQWSNYLSLVAHPGLSFAKGAREQITSGGFDLVAAGPLDQHWSGVVNPSFDTAGNTVSFPLAYGQYTTSGEEKFWTVRAGQFTPFALFLNQGGGPSMTLSTPTVLSNSATTGNTWTPTTPLQGIELGAVDLPHGSAYLGVAQPNLGPTPEPNTDLYASVEYLLGQTKDSVTAFGYWGNATLMPAANVTVHKHFDRVGGFANVYFPNSKIVAGYLTGGDRDVNGDSLNSNGYFLLGEYLPTDRLGLYARYDHLNQGLPGGGSQTLEGPTLGVTWWAQSQIRLTTEAQIQNQTQTPRVSTLTAEFMVVF